MAFKWKPNKDGWGGSCYQTLKMENGQMIQTTTKAEKCRPLDIKYIWNPKSRFIGKCYEIDSHKGKFSYSKSVKKDKCKPDFNNLRNVFVPNRKGQGGRCIQIDKKTNGYRYSKKINIEFCRLNE